MMETEAYLAAGYCATTGTYRSHHTSHGSTNTTATSFYGYLSWRLQSFPSDRPAFVDAINGATLSFGDLRTVCLKVASALATLGLRRGHVVLLVAPNSLYFPALSLTVLALGAVLSAANPLLTKEEFADQAHDSNPFLAITTAELAPKLPLTLKVVLVDELLAAIDDHDEWSDSDKVISQVDDPALLFYSSGTTGRSKGVVITHSNVIAATASLERLWQRRDDGRDVYGCVLPMFHMFGFSAFVLGTIAIGATTVLVPGRFSVDKLMAAMVDYGVTRLLVVPPMVVHMANKVAAAGAQSSRLCLREVVCSGAPLLRKHMACFRSCFPNVSLTQCYGLTETTGIVTICDLPSMLRDDDGSSLSVGRLVPGAEARIVDVDSGEALPPNRTGELWLRGPTMMQGYLSSKEATKAALVQLASDPEEAGRWLRTGDLCHFDSRGFLHVVDRLKELIKYKAYRVAPAELEDVLAAHPGIQDVAVAPYPDEEAGEIPVACVVKKPESHHLLQEKDIISFVQNKVAPYKMIRKVVFVHSIPRSPSGKILRAQLKLFLRTVTGAIKGGELQSTTPAAPHIGSSKL